MSEGVLEVGPRCNKSSAVGVDTNTSLLCFFVGFLSILITCGNLLVIISIVYFKQLHTPTNYLILSLAVADLLVGVVVLPLSMISVQVCGYLQNLICKLRSCFDIILGICSILNLCAISVDRYFSVFQPLTYRTKINVCVIVTMVLLSWTLSALNGITITVLGVTNSHPNDRCLLFRAVSLNIMGITLGFYIPAITMSVIYLKILSEARKQTRTIQNTTCRREKSERGMERKATKTLAIIMGVFLLCWTPFFLCLTFNTLGRFNIPVPVVEAFKWLGWSNSMLNPFVYAFFYSWFRSAFRMIVSGRIFHRNLSSAQLL